MKHLREATVLQPEFKVENIGMGAFAINDLSGGHCRTVAVVSEQGYIDWLLKNTNEAGNAIQQLKKEPHLSYVQGLKMELSSRAPATFPQSIEAKVCNETHAVEIVANGISEDNKYGSKTTARLSASPDGRYEWFFETNVRSLSEEPQVLTWIEYNNIYPGRAGRCFMFSSTKEYQSIIMTDAAGQAWRFPHQHLMHYGPRTRELNFKEGSIAGFFDEPAGNPVVILDKSTHAPDWAICDMYYDLHCGARTDGFLRPGDGASFSYRVKYLNARESALLLAEARSISIADEDRAKHVYPRIELGMNRFDRPVNIAGLDDASGFRPKPPQKIWDRATGCSGMGSLRISNSTAAETRWAMEPPVQIPANSTLKISGMAKAESISGRGMFVRLKYFTFEWRPVRHFEYARTLESSRIVGTTTGWVPFELPLLEVPPDHFDYLISIEIILDGSGTGWVTDLELNLGSQSCSQQGVGEWP